MRKVSKTHMLYWFPRISNVGLPVPKTLFLEIPNSVQDYVRSKFYLKQDIKGKKQFNSFISKLGQLALEIGLPCFLRTGLTSGKHHWDNTCYISDVGRLNSHVMNIAEYSELADLRGLPWKTWAVRELLPTVPAFFAFEGMPVTCEFRIFAKDGEMICCHPYWPSDVIKGHVDESKYPNWKNDLEKLYQVDYISAIELAIKASEFVQGDAWSIDVLNTYRGWYIIDMALAKESWHMPGCIKENDTGKR